MIKLQDILKEYFDAEDILSTLSQKGKPVEYVRIQATSPAGKEVSTGWMPYSEKIVKELTKEMKRQMYSMLKIEKKEMVA